MAKLNQIIAVEGTKKKVTEDAITKAYQTAQKADLFSGQIRTYQPIDDEGLPKPAEIQNVTATVAQVVSAFQAALVELADVTATKVWANTKAKADIVVVGTTLATDVPVEYLLFLEKRLVDVLKFIEKLPVLDPSVLWSVDPASGLYRSEGTVSTSNRKVMKNHVLAAATEKHPAQVQVYTEDEPVGHWTTVRQSGAVPATVVAAWKTKVLDLVAAVKTAREEANSLTVEDKKVGAAIFGYVFS